MHCFYSEHIEKNKLIELNTEENKHLKVLRLKENERAAITNGTGKFGIGSYSRADDGIIIENIYDNYNENNFKINLVCAIINDKNKIELIAEKATELGANSIIFFKAENSPKIKLKYDRLEKKVLGAMKQSNRSFLPKVIVLDGIDDILKHIKANSLLYFGDQAGSKSTIEKSDVINLVIGPESGFSKKDLKFFELNYNIINIKLALPILKTETASISMMVKANG
ncbi:RsmE family RNA methyltransferase [Candidatus Kapabacteria bacterium]|nr:RsmE family RNA methyltransferase [Candidatus Kapabacteria bacterium]